jgi:hypothetical protein
MNAVYAKKIKENLELLKIKIGDFNLSIKEAFNVVFVTYKTKERGIFRTHLEIKESMNCCGIVEVTDFVSMDDWYWKNLSCKERSTVGFLMLEYCKHMAWEHSRTLLYASIENGEQGCWIPWFKKSKWRKEYEVINNNTGNTILVYSFNLNDWKF